MGRRLSRIEGFVLIGDGGYVELCRMCAIQKMDVELLTAVDPASFCMRSDVVLLTGLSGPYDDFGQTVRCDDDESMPPVDTALRGRRGMYF